MLFTQRAACSSDITASEKREEIEQTLHKRIALHRAATLAKFEQTLTHTRSMRRGSDKNG